MEDLELFTARLNDMVKSAENGKVAFSHFLTEEEKLLSENVFNKTPFEFCFFGGNEKTQRKIAAISAFPVSEKSFPITVFKITGHELFSLSHRDILGALMGLGLTRQSVGDICFDKSSNAVYLFVTKSVAPLIKEELKTAGRVSLTLSEVSGLGLILPDLEFTDITFTAASKRADAVIAALLNLSREKSASLIDSKAVILNGNLLTRREKEIKEFDIFTVKGFGKFKVDFTELSAKKNRIRFLIKKYK